MGITGRSLTPPGGSTSSICIGPLLLHAYLMSIARKYFVFIKDLDVHGILSM